MKQILTLAALSLGLATSAANAQIRISELDSDTPGTDALEFIELYDGGVGNSLLDGLVVVFYNGSNDQSYAAFDLDGFSTDANGFFLMGNTAVVPAPALVFAGNFLQNGQDAVALYTGDASAFPNGTPVTATNLVDAIVYDTADPDDAGLLGVLGGSQVDEADGGPSDVRSVGRVCFPDGGYFTFTPPTPGALNGACTTDTDGDGVPDDLDNCPDIANPGQEDCNDNGVGDVCDIDSGRSQDCNQNGIPDECEEDCNQTGFPDDCDIILGISQDCNDNLIPDECEPDCDGNKVPDDCDIAKNPNLDIIEGPDGILDACQNFVDVVINEILADIPAGKAGDANNDGITNFANDEFIEIVNASGGAVNIGGWTISDLTGVRHAFAANTVIQNNCGIVVFGGGTPTGQFGGMLTQIASTTTLGLNNDGDTLTLRDQNGLLVTTVVYGAEADDQTSLTRNPDITGDFFPHATIFKGAALFSAGLKNDLTEFAGCATLPDSDNDGIPDEDDNCPLTANPDQSDCDEDGIGDACDEDPDKNENGIPDNCEVDPPAGLFLNELRIDQPSNDCDEFVELMGMPGTSLNGITLIVIGDGAGASGTIETVIPLQGNDINNFSGLFVIAESQFTLDPSAVDLVLLGGDATCNNGGLNLENSDNITVALVTNFTGAQDDDLDTNDDGILDSAPWGAVVDAVGLIEKPNPPVNTEYAYGAALGFEDVGPDTLFVPGHVYRCVSEGDWIIGLFDPFDVSGGTDTPGEANQDCPASCPADVAPPGGNGTVDIDDLFGIIGAWGTADPNFDIAPPGGNGIVDIDDLFEVIGAWGDC